MRMMTVAGCAGTTFVRMIRHMKYNLGGVKGGMQMTQEDKELLLKDLCARLPYLENWVQFEGNDYIVTGYGHGRVSLLPSLFSSGVGPCPLIEEIKPYLRPMSNMTEDERNEIDEFFGYHKNTNVYGDIICRDNTFVGIDKISGYLNWLNAHHFDYNGLIEKGLALESPEDMYTMF